jgi:hypothetical protein
MTDNIEAERVHEADREFPFNVWRMRVPGGWLYHITGTCPVFVPEAEQRSEPLAEAPVNFVPLSGNR